MQSRTIPKELLVYPSTWSSALQVPEVPVVRTSFSVMNEEEYEDKDLPYKSNFRHPWTSWSGVEVIFDFQGMTISGSRGKTVWYIPALEQAGSEILGIPIGTALKIIKHNVRGELSEEYERLATENKIQNMLCRIGLAPRAYNLVGVVNGPSNRVRWFDKMYYHPANSFYLASVVDHVTASEFPPGEIEVDEKYNLRGPLIERLTTECSRLGIMPRDICLGNVLFDGESLKVVDVHKWVLLDENALQNS